LLDENRNSRVLATYWSKYVAMAGGEGYDISPNRGSDDES
jgi:hypothetical protein